MSFSTGTATTHLTLNLGSKCRLVEVSKELFMRRSHPMIIFFVLAGGAGCQHMKRSEPFAQDGFAKVTFQIHGMMKAKSGAT